MMCMQTVVSIAKEQARKAAKEKKIPLVPASVQTVRDWLENKHVPIPNIGSYKPKGWKQVGSACFVSTSFEGDGGPAQSVCAYLTDLEEIVEQHPDYGYAIVQEGEFQLYIAAFERTR